MLFRSLNKLFIFFKYKRRVLQFSFEQAAALFRELFSIPTLVYYLTVTMLFLFFTAQGLEKRRWN